MGNYPPEGYGETWGLRMTQSNAKDDAPERCECGQFFKPCFECGTSANDGTTEAVALTPRDLFEIARPCFHYAKRGTPDGNYFERSETGIFLSRATAKIAAAIEAMRAAQREKLK